MISPSAIKKEEQASRASPSDDCSVLYPSPIFDHSIATTVQHDTTASPHHPHHHHQSIVHNNPVLGSVTTMKKYPQQQQQQAAGVVVVAASEEVGEEDESYSQFKVPGGIGSGSSMSGGTSGSLASWLNTMKDDIDGGLAADFDGSLSGLGVEMGTATYNMSEALLALPSVFKHEGEAHGFQYILMAPTSPATKVNEETLTYLNQGQSYEVKLKRLGATIPSSMQQQTPGYLRSVVRVVFHERRLQFMEREQLDTWRKTRPGERIVDTDIPLSYGLYDVNVDGRKLNSLEIVWDPAKDSAIFIKVHCISTEFTARKHGGEKGVPFRIQVETYANSDPTNRLLHCASCQVKVFKPKGADRKNKTDREKVGKRPDMEKEKYQPSYECTVLTEIPLEQVETYLEQLRKQEEEDEEQDRRRKQKEKDISSFQCLSDNSNSIASANSESPLSSASSTEKGASPFSLGSATCMDFGSSDASGLTVGAGAGAGALGQKSRGTGVKIKSESSSKGFGKIKSSPPGREYKSRKSSDSMTRRSSTSGQKQQQQQRQISPKLSPDRCSMDSSITKQEDAGLTMDATADEVADWLRRNRFSTFIKVFQNFSGADLLKLSRDDLTQICGLADGIRLNNSLQHKQVRPKLTIYICQPSKPKVRHNTNPESNNPSNVLDIGQIHISSQPPAPHPPAASHHPPGAVHHPPTAPHHPPISHPITTACDTRTLAAAIKCSAKQLEEFTVAGFEISNSNPFCLSTDSQDTHSKQFQFTAPPHPHPRNSQASGPVNSKPININAPSQAKTTQDAKDLPPSFTIPQTESRHGEVVDRSPSNSPSPDNMSPPRPGSAMFTVGAGGDANPPPRGSKQQEHMPKMTYPSTTAKRQFQEEDNSSDSTEYFTKKARTRNLELKRKDIYHAVYLDELSVRELCEHVSGLLCVPTASVSEILLLQQSGIRVLVTDLVIHNMPDNARYIITGTQDDSLETISYKVELKHVQ